jgi:hypothetical protein
MMNIYIIIIHICMRPTDRPTDAPPPPALIVRGSPPPVRLFFPVFFRRTAPPHAPLFSHSDRWSTATQHTAWASTYPTPPVLLVGSSGDARRSEILSDGRGFEVGLGAFAARHEPHDTVVLSQAAGLRTGVRRTHPTGGPVTSPLPHCRNGSEKRRREAGPWSGGHRARDISSDVMGMRAKRGRGIGKSMAICNHWRPPLDAGRNMMVHA